MAAKLEKAEDAGEYLVVTAITPNDRQRNGTEPNQEGSLDKQTLQANG